MPDWETMDTQIEPSIEHHLAIRHSEEQIVKLLGLLGQNCKDLLQAIIMEDLDYQEVADKLGYASTDVVKTQKHRCKKKLEELLLQRPYLAQILGKPMP